MFLHASLKRKFPYLRSLCNVITFQNCENTNSYSFRKTKVTKISFGFPCLIFLLAIYLVMLCLGLHPNRLLSLFQFVPWEYHSQAGSGLQTPDSRFWSSTQGGAPWKTCEKSHVNHCCHGLHFCSFSSF